MAKKIEVFGMANFAEKLGFDAIALRLGHCEDADLHDGTCEGCTHCRQIYALGKGMACDCRLTRAILLPFGCSLKGKDISGERVCVNCRHFLGGGDWGLSCSKEYHRLVDALDEACEDFEKSS